MSVILGLLTGPFRRYAIAALLVIAAAGAGLAALHQHDARIIAEQLARQRQAVTEARLADALRAADAAQAEALAAMRRERAAASIKMEISRAPVTQACVDSPAVRIALDRLRGAAGTGDRPPGDPARPVRLPAATRTP